MKQTGSFLILHSLKDLKVLKSKRTFSLPLCAPLTTHEKTDANKEPENEQRLFLEAMSGVKPISRSSYQEKGAPRSVPSPHGNNLDENAEVINQLSRLIKKGEGFVVAQTPEYVEGTGYNVKPEIAERLHQGNFAIDAHLDLHGLQGKEAKEIFDIFIKDTIHMGKRAILIVHGRGLSSPGEPVLKTKIKEWLTRGPWRKWVLAYASARLCDGGAGATYVLLRGRPYTNRTRKTKNG